MKRIDSETVFLILNDEDVEGLLALGAPSDEYTSEAQMIVDTLAQTAGSSTEDDILKVVTEVCNRMFGPFDSAQLRQRQPTYRQVARRILEAGERE